MTFDERRVPVADRIAISVPLDPYLPLKTLSTYSGISVRKLREFIGRSEAQALPCYRVDGKILVRRGDFDTWMARYRQTGDVNVRQTVSDVLARLRRAK